MGRAVKNRVELAASARWGGKRSSVLTNLALTVLAVAGAVVTGHWGFVIGAGLLGAGALYSVWGWHAMRSRGPWLVVEPDRLLVPDWSRGRWKDREIPFASIDSTQRVGASIMLWRRSEHPGGVVGVGAIPIDWYQWQDVDPQALQALIEQRIAARG
jgi:hypothetical protein